MLAEYGRPYRQIAVVTQRNIPHRAGGMLGDHVLSSLRSGGKRVGLFFLEDGERHKTMSHVERLCAEFSAWGLDRSDCVVGLGGGIVTDMTGLAASLYHRGIDVIHAPTTLIGQIDAAVGGKTAVNVSSGSSCGGTYKNVIGAFHAPVKVACGPEVLGTLPREEWDCGLGEMAKYCLLGDSVHADSELLSLVSGPDADVRVTAAQISACIHAKMHTVTSDPRDTLGTRALLNYGHTMAHALEAEQGGLRHGAEVAIGIMYEVCVARVLARVGDGTVGWHRQVLSDYGLDYSLPSVIHFPDVERHMRGDKKSRNGEYGFVLPKDGVDGQVTYGLVNDGSISTDSLRKAFDLHRDGFSA